MNININTHTKGELKFTPVRINQEEEAMTRNEIKSKIYEWVEVYYRRAENLYEIDVDRAITLFTKKGTTAGQFSSSYNLLSREITGPELNFNLNIAELNWPEFEETVAHEVAHHIVLHKWGRVQPHGPEWKQVMRDLGWPGKRCHSYKLPGARPQSRGGFIMTKKTAPKANVELSKNFSNEIIHTTRDLMIKMKGEKLDDVKTAIFRTGLSFSQVNKIYNEVKKLFPEDFPKPQKRGKLGIINRTLIEVFTTNKAATEEDLYKALRKVTKNERCAKDYTKQYYRMCKALANGLAAEDVI
jgi:predicted SprT family Zn-dependent metalloprotease